MLNRFTWGLAYWAGVLALLLIATACIAVPTGGITNTPATHTDPPPATTVLEDPGGTQWHRYETDCYRNGNLYPCVRTTKILPTYPTTGQ